MIFRKAIHFFVFGDFLIAFCSLGLTHLSQLSEEISSDDLHLLVFVFFATLLVYNLNLLLGMKGTKSSPFKSERHKWIVANERFIQAISILSIIITVVEIFFFKIETLFFLIIPGIFALAYAYPIKLPGIRTIRFREISFLKIFLVAWVWATFTVGLPIVQLKGIGAILEWNNFLLFFSRAIFIFAIVIPFDIRDLAYDTDKSVITIPSRFGIEKSKYFSVILLLLFSVVSFFRFRSGFCNLNELSALLLSGLTTAVLVIMINEDRKELFYSLWIEGTMLFQWILVILISEIV